MVHTRSGGSSLSISHSAACLITFGAIVKSSDNSLGLRKGTFAPFSFAIAAISLSSVDTRISSKQLLFCAVSIDHAIIGLFLKSFILVYLALNFIIKFTHFGYLEIF